MAYRKYRVEAEPSSPGITSDLMDVRKAQSTTADTRWHALGNRSRDDELADVDTPFRGYRPMTDAVPDLRARTTCDFISRHGYGTCTQRRPHAEHSGRSAEAPAHRYTGTLL